MEHQVAWSGTLARHDAALVCWQQPAFMGQVKAEYAAQPFIGHQNNTAIREKKQSDAAWRGFAPHGAARSDLRARPDRIMRLTGHPRPPLIPSMWMLNCWQSAKTENADQKQGEQGCAPGLKAGSEA